MSQLKKKPRYWQILFALIPMILSLAFVRYMINLLLVLTVITLFIIIAVVPIFKTRKSLWMFILSSIISIPINLNFSLYIAGNYLSYDYRLIELCLYAVLFYFLLLSIEEIILGIVSRLMWHRQR